MLDRLRLLVRSLVSRKANDELYALARAASSDMFGVRTRLTFHICLGISLILFCFLFTLSIRNESPERYAEARDDLALLTGEHMRIRVSTPQTVPCRVVDDCFAQLSRHAPLEKMAYEADDAPYADRYEKIKNKSELRQLLVRYRMELVGTRLPAQTDDLVIMLPRMKFERAHVYVGDVRQSTFLSGDPVYVPISASRYKGFTFTATVLLEVREGQDEMPVRWHEPAFAASHAEFKRYREFMEERRTNPSYQISTVARVILAIFALILFMIVESSPEAFGLALFMGFEAIALTTSNYDLRRNWLPDGLNITGFIHYCNAMGDIFRLYFFLQLCRLIPPAPGKWLAWGSAYGVVYGFTRHMGWNFGFPNWATHHVVQRDMLIAALGFMFTVRTAWLLRGRGLHSRVAALSLAAIASIAQGLGAAPYYLPFLETLGSVFGGYGALITVVNANSAYLFALSAFLNISTLEARVKVLSREKAKAEAIERELELGRQVQQAFLGMPQLPSEIRMAHHHEAAVYVSGDTYFVHWAPESRTLTFLLNDVTGHGIQAALKAFACNIVARSVWSSGSKATLNRRGEDARLKRYDQEVVELICKGRVDDGVPDFNAMVGVEFLLDQRKLKLYRVNYNFPVLVTPAFDFATQHDDAEAKGWKAKQLPLPNQESHEMPLAEGAYVLLVSDGFIETARDQREFSSYMNRALAEAPASLDPEGMKAMALGWPRIAERKIHDDRTMLVFQWHPYAGERVLKSAV